GAGRDRAAGTGCRDGAEAGGCRAASHRTHARAGRHCPRRRPACSGCRGSGGQRQAATGDEAGCPAAESQRRDGRRSGFDPSDAAAHAG
ncbi:hypothetical protein A8E01_28535, partial [Burkholderia cenocepacia]